jgi:hypothetical protein
MTLVFGLRCESAGSKGERRDADVSNETVFVLFSIIEEITAFVQIQLVFLLHIQGWGDHP